MKLVRQAESIAAFNQAQRDEWVAAKAHTVPPGSRVLDVGAGTARYRSLFTHCTYQTQDFTEYRGTTSGLFTEAWHYEDIDYVSDAAAIPVADGSFDVVLCTEVLEHVPEPIAVIREIGRVLRPGGLLFLSAPLGSGLHQQPHHYYGGFTPHFYRRFLPEAGMRVVAILPNGGFFRHLLQEVGRAGEILTQQTAIGRWPFVRKSIRAIFCYAIPLWFAHLDDKIPIEEFTIGYHVEAVRGPEL